MLLDISRLRTGVEDVDRRIEPAAFEDLKKDDIVVTEPASVVGTVRRDGRTAVVLVARVTSTFATPCSRCLESFLVPVMAEVETRFVPPEQFAVVTAETAATDGAVEPEGDDEALGVAEYRDEKIDLAEVVREQLYLALPMKPLCAEDCKGLCPECGVNRNRETCACQHEWVDPRMAALAEWKHRNEKSKG